MKNEDNEDSNLPPDQHSVDSILKWGIEHPGITKKIPEIDYNRWRLVVEGEVESVLKFTWEEFLRLPMREIISDFHCVETWSVLNQRWYGVSFKEIINRAIPKPSANFVWIECADGYTTSLEIKDLILEENMLAIKLNGELLNKELGGPVRLVVPQKYAYKSAMYINHIEFSSIKELGYWENRGYSDTADVWTNDRYSQ